MDVTWAPDPDPLTGNIPGNGLLGLVFSEAMDPASFVQGDIQIATVDIRHTDAQVNQDNGVGVPDLNFLFVPNFLKNVPPAGANFDLNCDNGVGVPDLNFFFVPQFLGQPGPSGLSCAGSVPCVK